jgi:hypothetical protein
MKYLKSYKIFESQSLKDDIEDICQDVKDEGVDIHITTDEVGGYNIMFKKLSNKPSKFPMSDADSKGNKQYAHPIMYQEVKDTCDRLISYMVDSGYELNNIQGFDTRSSWEWNDDELTWNTDNNYAIMVRFVPSSTTILEKEIPDEWFEKNPTNYLITNKHIKQNPKLSQSDKTIRSWLSEIDYKDITVTKKKNKSGTQVLYVCTYINKDYFMNDKRLMEFHVDDEFNRIHTSFGGQLDPSLRDMGLGYKCYKAVIDKVGWVRSSQYCTNENSRRVWKSLIKDPDYYAFEVETMEDGENYNGFIVFKKTMSESEIKKILKDFTKAGNKIITYDTTLSKYEMFKESKMLKVGDFRATCEDILLDLKDEGYETKIIINNYDPRRKADPSAEVKWVNVEVEKEGHWTKDVHEVISRLCQYFESEGLKPYSQDSKYKVPGTENTYGYSITYYWSYGGVSDSLLKPDVWS